MSQEIIEAVREIERDKGIEEGALVAALEDALLAAYKKTPGASRHATVELDEESGDFRVFSIELPSDIAYLGIETPDDALELAMPRTQRSLTPSALPTVAGHCPSASRKIIRARCTSACGALVRAASLANSRRCRWVRRTGGTGRDVSLVTAAWRLGWNLRRTRGESSGDGGREKDHGGQHQQHDVQPAPGCAQPLSRSEFDAVRTPSLLRSLHHRRLLPELATAPSMPVAPPY